MKGKLLCFGLLLLGISIGSCVTPLDEIRFNIKQAGSANPSGYKDISAVIESALPYLKKLPGWSVEGKRSVYVFSKTEPGIRIGVEDGSIYLIEVSPSAGRLESGFSSPGAQKLIADLEAVLASFGQPIEKSGNYRVGGIID